MRMHPAIRPLMMSAAVILPAVLPMSVVAQTLAPGTALVSVVGDVETSLVLPLLPESATPTQTGFDLRFQDAALDTLNVTLAMDGGQVTDAFVGVGVPGTSIFDEHYFADFLHTRCTTSVVALDTTGIAAVIDCVGLEIGAGDATIDLHAELTTMGLPSASSSPTAGSPGPSALPASPRPGG